MFQTNYSMGYKLMILLMLCSSVKAQDTTCNPIILGGQMYYEWLGPSYCYPSCGLYSFRVVLKIYLSDSSLAQPTARYWVWNNDNPSTYYAIRDQALDTLKKMVEVVSPCSVGGAPLNYWVAIYRLTLDVDPNSTGYTVTYSTNCN